MFEMQRLRIFVIAVIVVISSIFGCLGSIQQESVVNVNINGEKPIVHLMRRSDYYRRRLHSANTANTDTDINLFDRRKLEHEIPTKLSPKDPEIKGTTSNISKTEQPAAPSTTSVQTKQPSESTLAWRKVIFF